MSEDASAAPDTEAVPGVAPADDGSSDTAPDGRRGLGVVAKALLLPRGVVILLGLAAAVVTLAGVREVRSIVAPIFMALCLTITVYPLRTWMERKGTPSWLATLALILGVYAVLFGLVFSFIWGIARFASILPEYQPQIQATINNLKEWLAGLGVDQTQIANLTSKLDASQIVSAVGAVVSGAASVLSGLIFVIVLVLFLSVDGAAFPKRMSMLGGRIQAQQALASFTKGTRKYFAVSTIFGGIVAVLDGIALVLFAIPAPALWALLAFVTNYIPNVGFIIGLIPVAFLGLLTGGFSTMIWIIVVYCALNFVIQSVLQPKFVGDAVGLTTTMSFLSLIIWAYVLGPLGAILAVPATLLCKAVLVDVDPDARWLQLFLGDEPVFKDRVPREGGSRFRRHKRHAPAAATTDPAAAVEAGPATA